MEAVKEERRAMAASRRSERQMGRRVSCWAIERAERAAVAAAVVAVVAVRADVVATVVWAMVER